MRTIKPGDGDTFRTALTTAVRAANEHGEDVELRLDDERFIVRPEDTLQELIRRIRHTLKTHVESPLGISEELDRQHERNHYLRAVDRLMMSFYDVDPFDYDALITFFDRLYDVSGTREIEQYYRTRIVKTMTLYGYDRADITAIPAGRGGQAAVIVAHIMQWLGADGFIHDDWTGMSADWHARFTAP